ncbi:hypothetical protein Pcinc_017611 [Petrolisthes cinctipes]|uniref:Uncharacterized protein n=1 Tax=Petrolisthes cinctipes TaxID=88211 RepID=A0AAE1KPQ7_PETCI|nr:hypothetical protein Pcinc_017611 [Petrolisthes cinctipes]
MGSSDCMDKLGLVMQLKAAQDESSNTNKKDKLALMISMEGGKVSSKVHINSSPQDLAAILNGSKDEVGDVEGYVTKEMQKHYGCVQEQGEEISHFINRLKVTAEKFTCLSGELKDRVMRDLLVYGMLSVEAKNKILEKKAGWEEAMEIAQEDEYKLVMNLLEKEIYEYATGDEDKEKEKEKKTQQKSKEQNSKVSHEQDDKEKFRFNSLDLLSLFVTMTLKRIVNNEMVPREHFSFLLKIINENLDRMKVANREGFCDTLRDHARMYHREWSKNPSQTPKPKNSRDKIDKSKEGIEECKDEGRILFNTYLLVLSLKLGLKKPWVPEGYTGFNAQVLQKELKALYGGDPPKLAVKQLNQKYPCFEVLFPHCTDLESIFLNRADEAVLHTCFTFKNLRFLEFHGRVPEKFLCNGLWGVKKSSKKILDLALTDPSELIATLPHLEVIRCNILKGFCNMKERGLRSIESFITKEPPLLSNLSLEQNSLPETFGAAAIAIQPSLSMVENLGIWDTTDAILFLLDREAQLKSKVDLRLGIRHIMVDSTNRMDTDKFKKMVQLCPKFKSVAINRYHPFPIQPFSIIKALPMKQITHLDLNVMNMPGKDLIRVLDDAPNLEVLSLTFDPRWPIIGDLTNNFFHHMMKLNRCIPATSKLQVLSLDFTLDMGFDDNDVHHLDWNAKSIMAFLQCFPAITTLHLENSIAIPAPLLVYGCLGGALACLTNLRHLSLMSCHKDLPREMYADSLPAANAHCMQVSSLMPDLQDSATFPHLAALETFEVDELYLTPCLDRVLEALRVEGVNISTHYRSSIRSFYGRHDTSMMYYPPPI